MTSLRLLEHHRFEAAGKPFVYLVPSAAIFALDPIADAIMRLLGVNPLTVEKVVSALQTAFDPSHVESTLRELVSVRAIGETVAQPVRAPKVIPLTPFPLTTMVLNVTNQCNLSCTYCYEYGADKIVDTVNGKAPKFMTEETARQSVDFMLKESGANPVVYLTFFGGGESPLAQH